MCFVARPRELKVFSVLFFSGWFLIGDKVFANVPPRVGLPIVVFVFPFCLFIILLMRMMFSAMSKDCCIYNVMLHKDRIKMVSS